MFVLSVYKVELFMTKALSTTKAARLGSAYRMLPHGSQSRVAIPEDGMLLHAPGYLKGGMITWTCDLLQECDFCRSR